MSDLSLTKQCLSLLFRGISRLILYPDRNLCLLRQDCQKLFNYDSTGKLPWSNSYRKDSYYSPQRTKLVITAHSILEGYSVSISIKINGRKECVLIPSNQRTGDESYCCFALQTRLLFTVNTISYDISTHATISKSSSRSPATNRLTMLVIVTGASKLFSLPSTHSLNLHAHISPTTTAPLPRTATRNDLTGVMAYTLTECQEHPTPLLERYLVASSPHARHPFFPQSSLLQHPPSTTPARHSRVAPSPRVRHPRGNDTHRKKLQHPFSLEPSTRLPATKAREFPRSSLLPFRSARSLDLLSFSTSALPFFPATAAMYTDPVRHGGMRVFWK